MMAASSRHVDSPHAGGNDADALHKMAAAAAREQHTDTDENKPSNANKPPVKKALKEEPKQQSESDDEDADDDGDDDDESGDKSKSATSSVTDKGDDDDKKTSKKSRRELPPHTVAILKGWMLSPEHVKHPYPTDEDKQMLLKKTGINMKQLTNWFTNARKRIWKPMMRREHSRQLQSAMEYEKARGVPEGYPGAPPMPYREGPYPPRPSIRHSFDAGSLGAPPRDPQMPPYHHPYEMQQQHGYPVPPQHAYPPRVMRSVSESATAHEVDDYIDAMRIRKRVHELSPDGVEADGMAHADKRFRRAPGGGAMLSPRCMKILQDWVVAHSHMEYPLPADSDKLQLSRDTGLDVQQIELWFKNNVGRYGAPLQAPPPPTPQQAPQPLPHGHPAYRSTPSRENPMYPPPPAYGERRSIPTQGNSMFPPRPAVRSSIPGAGNPQFPPPPAVRRDSSDGYRQGMPPSYPGGPGGVYPPPQHSQGFHEGDPARPMRTLSINSGYAHAAASQGAPPVAMPTPVGAPGGSASGLPSLTGRPMPSAARGGPPVGQARDSRSHTLDMGQFAEARRRKMNFQDILASTSSQQQQQQMAPAPVAPRPPLGGNGYDATRPPNAENIYPTEVGAPYAQKMYEQQQRSAMMAAAQHPGNGAVEPQGSARI